MSFKTTQQKAVSTVRVPPSKGAFIQERVKLWKKKVNQIKRKVVQVQGPAKALIPSQMMGWRIKPLFPAPWGVTQLNGSIGVEVVDWNSCIFHEDEWLMPLRPLPPEEIWREIQVQIDQGLLELGAVTG